MHQATFDCLGSFAMCGAGEGFFVGQGERAMTGSEAIVDG
jgi:hypothetical protein